MLNALSLPPDSQCRSAVPSPVQIAFEANPMTENAIETRITEVSNRSAAKRVIAEKPVAQILGLTA
jgi:hypothetical protein